MAQRINATEATRIIYGGSMSEINLKLWESVENTNPAFTKDFSKAGGFKGTSINPTYNNRKATEVFGICGIGWGFVITDESYRDGAPIIIEKQKVCNEIIHVLKIDFWFIWEGQKGVIPSFGQTTFVGSNKWGCFTDEEAPKKSLTDAITKALSILGFSADIFTGMYDDSKYINDMKEKFTKEAEKPRVLTAVQKEDAAKKKAEQIITEYKSCKDLGMLADVQQKYHNELKRFDDAYPDIFKEINAVGVQIIASFDQ